MLTIFLNRTYATNVHIIDMLRDNPDGRPVRVLASHADPDSPVLAAADRALPEPGPGVTGAAYVDWALDVAARHHVDVFVPRLELAAIAAATDRFAAIGTAVLAPPAAAVTLFDDKAAAYADAASRGLPVPPYRVVTDAAGLLDAVADLPVGDTPLCIKPVTGVGGDGFRVLVDDESLSDLLGPLAPSVTVSRAVAALAAATRAGQPVPPLLVLPLLTGPEVSVDVLADAAGRTLAAVGRIKQGRRRTLVDDRAARTVAETLVAAHQLRYLSNTQVRYWQGPGDSAPRPYLLEVNPRMAGGLFQTRAAGVNLAWAAVRLALGADAAVGEPRFGAAFTTVAGLVPLPDPPALRNPAAAQTVPTLARTAGG